MGVRGLATLAKTHQAAISQVLEFPVASTSSSSQQKSTTTLSIDAWAWVYLVWADHFGESTQGGNYADLIEFVKDAVTAWRACLLEPVFIWDGPIPLLKQPCFLERRAQYAAGNSTFMRSSVASRSSKGLQLECYPFVPLWAQAIKSALAEEGVRSEFAQAEADGPVAELADETGGLAASLDSDFFVLCSRGSGRGRYTPVDTWEYMVEETSHGTEAGSSGDAAEANQNPALLAEADGFEAVKSKRRKNKTPFASSASERNTSSHSRSSISYPPPRAPGSGLRLKSIVVRVYDPQKFAAQLRIPSALLPLLGAVAGNDYTTAAQTSALFRRSHTGPERIREAAEVIHREWLRAIGGLAASKQTRRAPSAPTSRNLAARMASKNLLGVVKGIEDDTRSEYSDASSATATPMQMSTSQGSLNESYSAPLDPVRSLVCSVVSSLLERADVATYRSKYVSDSDKEMCIDSIIESMATYSLLTDISSTQVDDPAGFWYRVLPADANRRALESYRDAYQSGTFSEQIVSALVSRVLATTLAPEDPDQKTIHVGAARTIRRWTYAIIFGVWGMDWARDSMDEPAFETEDTDSRDEEVPIVSQLLLDPKAAYKVGERPDDVISVDTESESEGEQEQLDDAKVIASSIGAEDEEGDGETYAPPLIKPPPAVREYVRKGERLVGELVPIADLADLLAADIESLPPSLAELHAQYLAARTGGREVSFSSHAAPTSDPMPPLAPLLPLRTRLDLYKHVLHSSGEAMVAVPLRLLPLAASLRHIIRSMAQEAGESKKRLNWTLPEVTSAILAGCHVATVYSERLARRSGASERLLPRTLWTQPTSRAIHLASCLQLVLESANHLASSLLLNNVSSSSGEDAALPSPHVLFDGPIFHLILAHNGQRTEEMNISDEAHELADTVLNAVLADGFREDLAVSVDELKRLRRENKKKAKGVVVADPDPDQDRDQDQQQQPRGKAPAVSASARKGNRHTHNANKVGSQNGKNAFELLMGE